jgi:hypothetical protein
MSDPTHVMTPVQLNLIIVSVVTKLKNVGKELYEMSYTTTTKFVSADVFIKILHKFLGYYLYMLS